MKIKIDIDAKDLIRSINNAIDNVEDVVSEEIQEAGKEILNMAKGLVPVDTGELKSSLKKEGTGMEAIVGTDCEYAQYVHFGTSRQSPKPFLYIPFDNISDDIDEEIADEVISLFD